MSTVFSQTASHRIDFEAAFISLTVFERQRDSSWVKNNWSSVDMTKNVKYKCPTSSIYAHGLNRVALCVWVVSIWLFHYGCVILYMFCLEAECMSSLC